MSEPPGTQPTRAIVTPSRIVVAVCLIAPFVALLWVSSYAKAAPDFIGIPFFYWYQMAWVPISAALTSIAYLLVRREQRAARAHTGGTPE